MLANHLIKFALSSQQLLSITNYISSQFHFSPSSCYLILSFKFLLFSDTLNVHILSFWHKTYVLHDIKEHVQLHFCIFQTVHL